MKGKKKKKEGKQQNYQKIDRILLFTVLFVRLVDLKNICWDSMAYKTLLAIYC